jgi:hypothetical protein
MDDVPKDYAMILFGPIKTKDVTVIADTHFMIDQNRGEKLVQVYNNTKSVQYFEGNKDNFDTSIYPYTSMKVNQEGFSIDIREGQWDKDN